MEHKLQVDHTIVMRDSTSINLKEVGFQIPFLNCCKKSILLVENALHFYG